MDAADVLSLPDTASIIVPIVSVFAFFFGSFGFATEVLGRRVTSAFLVRLLGPDEVDGRVERTTFSALFATFIMLLGLGLLVVLVADGLNRGIPWRVVTGTIGLIVSSALAFAVYRGTMRS